MKNSIKQFISMLLAVMLIIGMMVPASAANAGEIPLAVVYSSDNRGKTPVSAVEANDTFYAVVNFYGCPTTSALDSVCAFGICISYDQEKMTMPTKAIGRGSLNPTFAENVAFINYSTRDGLTELNGDDEPYLVGSGRLFALKVTAKEALTSEDLSKIKIIDSAIGKNGVKNETYLLNGHSDEFTIVKLPHFAASVDANTKFYTRSTALDVKAALTYTFINADGTPGTVDTDKVEVTLPEGGLQADVTNKVTVEYEGYTCVVDVTAELDVRTAIKVTKVPTKMSYISGETLNLTDLEVEAEYKSGYKHVLDSGVYGTIPSKTMPLTVKDHDKTMLKVKLGELEADVGTLTVSPADISTAVIGDITGQTYQGEAGCKPEPTVTFNNETLTKDVDYKLSYENNVDAGSNAKIKVTGMGEYTGSTEKTFTIGRATGSLILNVSPATITYGNTFSFTDGDGNSIGGARPTDIEIHYRKTGMSEDNTFNFTNPMAVGAGSYEFWAVRPEDSNNEKAESDKVSVTIEPRSIADEIITITIDSQTYTGSPLTPDVTAMHGSIPLVKDKDYTLGDYKFNLNATTESQLASVKVTGKDNYTGERTVTFTIKPQWLSVTASNFLQLKDGVESVTYTGLPITPKVDDSITVGTNNPIMLTKDVDYTVEYESNINAGTAKITIKSKTGSNYTFDKFTVDFTINPVKIKINSSQYDWVPYVDGDKIKGYDSDGGGQQSPYFDYDGKEHGIKLQFKDDARVNEIKLETLVKCTYTNAVNTNASGYTAYVTLKLNKDYETNYQLLGSSDTPVPDRTLTKTWSIHKATLQVTAPDLNIRCLELAGEKPVDYTYSLDWLGTGVKPNNLKITLKGLTCDGEPAYDNAGNTITFPQVTAKKAGTPTDSVELELGFTNYESIRVTIPVKYINKLSVSDKLSMADIEVVYGQSYAPVLKLKDEVVTDKTLYKITYTDKDGKPVTNPKNAGTYTIKATYEDDTEETVEGVTYPGHIGEKTATLTIKKRPLTADVKHAAITYGEAVDVNDCTVTFGNLVTGESLTKGTDFTVSTDYKTGDDVGDEYGFFITLDENSAVAKNYTVPTVTGTLTVNPKSLTAAMVEDVTAGLTYNGNEQTPTVTVKDGEKTLTSGTDYTLTYKNNTNAGTATVTVEGKGNYTGKVTKTFKINPATITEEMIAAIQAVTYTGKAQTPALTIKYNGMTLKEGTDYTVAYTSNTNAGSAAAAVIGKGNYTGKVEKPFTINKAAMVFDENQTVFRRSTVTGEQTESLQTIKGVQGETLSPALTLEAPGAQGILDSAAIDGTNVKFTITGSEGKANYKVKMTMPANGNYQDGEYTLKFEVADKNDVSGSITFPNGSSVYTGAPQTYEKATLNPNLAGTWTYTYTAVDGSGASLKGGLPLTVGTYRVAASFTNADNVGAANATFVITKATPPTPPEVKVDGEDKTLKDLEDSMRKDLGAIEGEFTWRDSDGKELDKNTKIEANKEYEWIFTPTGKDAKNYLPISGKTTPYVRDDLSWLPGVLGGGSTFNFRDVTRYDYFYNAVKWAAENGIASGTSRYTFSPDAVCTRAQTVTFLWRAAGSPMPSYRISPFTDVNYGDYYYNAVLWAVEQGITTGLTATTFGPDKTVTRGQVAMFLYRAASAVKPNITNSFTDVKSTAYNYDAILWAYDNRITTGTSTTTFSPDAFCTRAQIVTFLYRFYQGR